VKDDPVSQQVLAVGITPLVPLPFLDGLVRARLLREIYARIAKSQGITLDEETLKILTGVRGNLLLGCIFGVIWYPIRKLLRTIIYVLTLKECVDVVSEAVIRSEMVRRALEDGHLPARAEEVRHAMDSAVKRYAGSPLVNFLRRRGGLRVHLHRNDKVAKAVGTLATYGGFIPAMGAFSTALEAMELRPLLTDGEE